MEPRALPASTGAALEIVRAAPVALADDWTDERKEFIRKAFCGGAPDDIAAVFLEICRRRRLSPEARQIYLVNRGGKDKPNWVIQTGIDGFRLIADRTERYAGSSDPVFVHDPEGRVAVATITVNKLVGGVVGAFTASARWDEYEAGGTMWNKMPHTMLAKCAEALALRKAFPEELSGIYTDAEMDQAEYDRRDPASAAPRPTGADPERRGRATAALAEHGSNEGAMKAVHAAAKEKKIEHERLHELAVGLFGVGSMSECDTRQLTELRYLVRDASADQLADVATLAAAIAEADERECLGSVAAEIPHAELPDIAKRLLTAAAKRVGERLAA